MTGGLFLLCVLLAACVGAVIGVTLMRRSEADERLIIREELDRKFPTRIDAIQTETWTIGTQP